MKALLLATSLTLVLLSSTSAKPITNCPNPDDLNYGLRLPAGFDRSTLATNVNRRLSSREMAAIPESFDARTYFTACTDVISRIGNQAHCGSCWAHGMAFSASDRICVASKGAQKPLISVEDLMECLEKDNDGCGGGDPLSAWKHYVHEGLVTAGCKSYLFEHDLERHATFKVSCQKTCENAAYRSPGLNGSDYHDEKLIYLKDKHYGAAVHTITSPAFGENESNQSRAERIASIKLEIMKNGPVTTVLYAGDDMGEAVIEDRPYNTEYVWTKNCEPNHAVRMIGWGVQKGVEYWLIANSWGTAFGQGGTFKVQVGRAMIDDLVIFGTPKL